MTLEEIPEFPEMIGNFGAVTSQGLNMQANDDLWIVIAIVIFESGF
ncbi:hypothetical protein [Alterisphingorhabdus coralli]|uniref:Uncharacterized protein n=1 Tax=Alterisphingorhabdus coralli TaxID=3071408 RepID=A0AA97I2Z1_9SPHN|nr:hypothetical protein [Parasphingorhabdus sp. SCSIO 66989]WOE76220.1 hypothetical protein RB602_05780 [Parasphingorhabdus sp. SCSIO 66989]